MAGRTDEVDLAALQKLAWTNPADVAEHLASGGLDELTEEQMGQLRLRVSRVSEDVRRLVSGITAMPPESPERASAVDRLLSFIADLDLELLGLEEDDPQTRQLLPLYLEGRARQPVAARVRILQVFLLGPVFKPDPAIASDVYVEVVRAADFDVAMHLREWLEEQGPQRVPARLGREIGAFLTHGTPAQCAIASYLLECGVFPSAAPMLREALRSKIESVRTNAISALLALEALTADDVRWLVEDACAFERTHDFRATDLFGEYQEKLVEAVRRVRPLALVPWLVQKLGLKEDGFITRGLESHFALRLLAVLEPERVLTIVDGLWARDVLRRDAIEIAATLPDEHARPRLARMATAFDVEEAECARTAWSDRFGEPCPVPRSAGPLEKLLSGPPSDDFAMRLQILDGPSKGAALLTRKLLDEAPTRENLVLLLRHALDPRYGPTVEGVPGNWQEWPPLFVRRFGAELFTQALLLVANDAERAFTFLHELARQGQLPAQLVPQAVDAALEVLRRHELLPVGATELLALIPTPPDAWKALWPHIHAPGGEHDHPPSRFARETLKKLRGCPRLNDAVVAALSQPSTDCGYCELADLACARRLRRAYPRLLEILESFGPDRDWMSFLRLGWSLLEAGVIDHAWIRRWLKRPEHPLFSVATSLEFPEKVRGATPLLKRVFDSDLRGGRAALDALRPFVAGRDLRASHPRVTEALSRASERDVLWFFQSLRFGWGSGTEGPGEAFLRLLGSEDEATANAADDLLLHEDDEPRRALYAAALPRVKHRKLRARMERFLGLPPTSEDGEWDPEPEIESAYLAAQDALEALKAARANPSAPAWEEGAADDEGMNVDAPEP